MNRMRRMFPRSAVLLVVVAMGWTMLSPASRAASPTKLEKHARKIAKKLARYRPGAFLEVDLRNGDSILGSLGKLAGADFQILDSDSNKMQSVDYADVASVKTAKEYIGDGSEPSHRFRHWTPLLIGAAAVAAAGASYAGMR